ncbi:MAG: hypothetical protein ABMA01_00225 [Chthoniobacteraceae bacterium]
MKSLFTLLTLHAGCLLAADIPAHPLASKGESIFSDDFNRAELGGNWRIGTPTFSITDGVLHGGQTGPGHSAVGFVKVGRKDVIVEFKMRFDRAKSINAVFNDKDYKEGHAGHICRVSFLPGRIFLADDKERLRHDIEELRKDPKRKAEADKLVEGRTLGFPNKLDPTKWYRVRIELLGDELRVSLDDRPVAHLKSSGIAHAMGLGRSAGLQSAVEDRDDARREAGGGGDEVHQCACGKRPFVCRAGTACSGADAVSELEHDCGKWREESAAA